MKRSAPRNCRVEDLPEDHTFLVPSSTCIVAGYRVDHSTVWDVFLSFFTLHNETVRKTHERKRNNKRERKRTSKRNLKRREREREKETERERKRKKRNKHIKEEQKEMKMKKIN